MISFQLLCEQSVLIVI